MNFFHDRNLEPILFLGNKRREEDQMSCGGKFMMEWVTGQNVVVVIENEIEKMCPKLGQKKYKK